MKTTVAIALALCTSLMCSAKGDEKGPKFTTDAATGVKYHFFKQNKAGVKPTDGDFATVILVFKNDKDSLILDSRKVPNKRRDDSIGTVTIPLKKTFNGCLEQGICLMAVGDSAEFLLSSDSLFLKTFKQKALPAYAKPGSFLTFYIKLVTFETQAEMQKKQQDAMAEQQLELIKLKNAEPQTIAKYLSDNKITVKPTTDSLFILDRQGATGKQVQDGDSLYVDYVGMLMNGKVFDASKNHGSPLKLVYSQNMQLIKGWVEVLGTMHEGEKAKILLPSSLGYGGRQVSADILPYSPLIFELQIDKIVSNSPQAAPSPAAQPATKTKSKK